MDIKSVRQPDSVIESTVTFNQEEWNKAKEKAFRKILQTLEVKGFRKGHVPEVIARQHVNPQKQTDDAINNLVQPAYEALLKEGGFEPILQPSVRLGAMDETKVELIFTLTVRPEVVLGQYEGHLIVQSPVTVTEEEVAAEITKIQNEHAMLMVKDNGEVSQGNTVTLNFEGFVDGAPFEGGKADGYDLEIGSNSFVPGFESQLVGMKINTPAEIKVTFPQNYVANLAGKEATFKILITAVKEKVLPEMNDDLALSANIEGVSTLEALKAHVHHDIEHRKEHDAEHKATDDLMKTISDLATVEVPHTLVKEETEHSFEDYKKRIEQNGLKFDQYLQITNTKEEDIKANLEKDAKAGLKLMFVLSEIARKNDVRVTEEDVEKELQAIATQYNMEITKVKDVLKDRLSELRNDLFNRKVNAYLLTKNTIQKS